MSLTLVRKELRDQRFFALLGLVLLALDLYEVVLSQIDSHPLVSTFPGLDDGNPLLAVVVAFAVGSGLLAREVDEGTLGFLDGLPVTRARIFAVKLGTAFGVLMVYPVGHVLLFAWLHLIGHGSLDAALHPGLLGMHLLLMAAVTLIGLLGGMFVGFSRSLTWGVLAAAFALFKVAIDELPWLAAFSPLELAKTNVVGLHWQVSRTVLGTQLMLGAACGAAALVLFTRAGRASNLDAFLKRPVVAGLVAMGTVTAVVAAVALAFKENPDERRQREEDDQVTTARFTDAPAGHASTAHYRFSYPAHRAEQMQALLAGADRAYERVEQLLGIDGGGPVTVDLSGSMANTSGTASLETIRMTLESGDALAVLAHETSHVFAGRTVGVDGLDELSGMGVFDEGLGKWVERHYESDAGLTEIDRLAAAVISNRRTIPAALLTEQEKLYRAHGETVRYPLGAALIEAFVKRYGPHAPRKVLQTLADPSFPKDLSGAELWQTAFQLSGFDLPLVLDDYTRLLRTWEKQLDARIKQLPRQRGLLYRAEGWAGVQVKADSDVPEGWTSAVRFRPEAESPLRDYRTQWVADGAVAWEPLEALVQDQVCFQIGLETQGVELYEPWQCLPLESAAVWE